MAPPDEQGGYSLSELTGKSRKSRAAPRGLCIVGIARDRRSGDALGIRPSGHPLALLTSFGKGRIL